LTCAVGFGAFFIIVDFPELATKSRNFLNAEETTFVVARLEDDRADVIPEPFHLKSYLKHGLDIEIWGFASIFGLTLTSTYAIAYFLPIILNSGMHFSIAKSQCLVTPPYAAAAIYMYVLAVFCDKYRIRGAVIALNAVVGLVGLPLLGYAKSAPIRYFGVFLATISCNANVPVILTYQANNVRGESGNPSITFLSLIEAQGNGNARFLPQQWFLLEALEALLDLVFFAVRMLLIMGPE